MPADPATSRSPTGGSLFALGAFLLWGVTPLYFRALGAVPALEILSHRIAWSAPLLLAVAALTSRMKPVLDVLRRPRIILALAGTSALLALNWLVFLWAVEQHQVVQVSLGYFINPLLNVALGALLLRERLNRAQGIAVALAAASVLFLAISAGEMPRVALLLAGSFGLYGLFRKQLPIDPLTGLLVETALLWPLAVAGLVAVGLRGDGALGRHGLTTDALMLLAGAWTAVPLLCFVAAARRLTLTTLGFFQYIAPSLQFLTAVVLWDEPFDATRLLAFGGIWLGLAIVSADALLRSRRERPAPG